MSNSRRWLFGVGGLTLVLIPAGLLFEYYGNLSIYYRKRALLNQVFAISDGVTPLVLAVTLVGFSLLASAALGEPLLSRRWLVSAVAALILAWLLVGGIAVSRAYICSEPEIYGGVQPEEYD